jgi:thiol-disulfide isomerase/thioredoxin
MVKKLVLAALLAVAGTVLWWFFTPESRENRVGPPVAGSIRHFNPTGDAGPAPRSVLLGAGEKRARIADFRGKVVLVNFWATWCAPCIREMPSLVRLQQARGGTGFTVIALSQDFNGWKVVEPFLKRHDLSALPVYVDEKTAIARALGVQGLPTSILLDREGRELGRLTGDAEWDTAEALALVDYYLRANPIPSVP